MDKLNVKMYDYEDGFSKIKTIRLLKEHDIPYIIEDRKSNKERSTLYIKGYNDNSIVLEYCSKFLIIRFTDDSFDDCIDLCKFGCSITNECIFTINSGFNELRSNMDNIEDFESLDKNTVPIFIYTDPV